MNKTAIKNFAIWARNKLIADISYRAGLMGITADGIHAALPQSTGQTEFYDIGTAEPYAITGEAIRQRRHLVELIQRKEKDTDYKTAYKYIIEEVAYTWFNRLIAVRFMEVNDYLPSHIRVLSSDAGKLEPDLVTTPFDAELEFTNAEQQTIIDLKNANKLDEVFRILFIKQCNALNEILPALFEKTNDYTELLLNLSVIDQDGVVYHLVHDIPEEDFDVERGGQVEIIGWLYQYYNTEPKNEAFAKKGKITKEEVPAVTQLFTPDWIVRYMVENSLGRLWVEGHPNEDLKAGWKYYLEEAEQEPAVQEKLDEIRKEYANLNPEDINIIDPCMGSGHILVYAFDVLMQIYESAGYGQRDAARSILENNLYGLDIDDRAFQMAYFAIMMKARQYNRRILNGNYKPNLYSIRESNGINRNQLKYFGNGMNDKEKKIAFSQMNYLLDTFIDAKEYGSILPVEKCNWGILYRFTDAIEEIGQMNFDTLGLEETAQGLKELIAQGIVLSEKYEIAITNPPYMSLGNATKKLNDFAKERYPDSKTDLYSIFIERCEKFLQSHGMLSMITMHSWMFLASFELLRNHVQKLRIVNLLHLGARAFDEIGGEVVQTVAFVIVKSYIKRYKGNYCRLIDGSSEKEKENMYLSGHNRFNETQDRFALIPTAPIAYWTDTSTLNAFSNNPALSTLVDFCKGLATMDNNRFLRLWFEISADKMSVNARNAEEGIKSGKKWFAYNKGGEYRRWYGNRSYVINWFKNGKELKDNVIACYHGGSYTKEVRNEDKYFCEGMTWSTLSSGNISFRFSPKGSLFDSKASMGFVKANESIYVIMAYLNSNVAQHYLELLSPTLDYNIRGLNNLPYVSSDRNDEIMEICRECIRISKDDWDSFETSWDFVRHPLVKKGIEKAHPDIKDITIEESYQEWSEERRRQFNKLKNHEETINSIYIEIHNLREVLKPAVKIDEITVHQADLQRDIKSLLSYAVGCMFGRYSINHNGLAYAGGEWDEGKYVLFRPDTDNVIPISDEEYLEDDIVVRLCKWLKVVYGEQTLEENLDYIAKTLGNKGDSSRDIIRNYFLNDFFKDHCQTYSVAGSGKRPIYWLFDSGKQNGFKALIYLHRYNADTIGNLRIDYLHRMQRVYESEISRMQDMIDYSTNAREVGQATKRKDKLIKQLKECREYDEKLAHLALSRIELDLDDGVKVNYRKLQTANDGKFYEVLADSKNIMSKK